MGIKGSQKSISRIRNFISRIDEKNYDIRLKFIMPLYETKYLSILNIYCVKDLKKLTEVQIDRFFNDKENDNFINMLRLLSLDLREYFAKEIGLGGIEDNSSQDDIHYKILKDRSEGMSFQHIVEKFEIDEINIKNIIKNYVNKLELQINSLNKKYKNVLRAIVKDNLFLTDEDLEYLFKDNWQIYKYLFMSGHFQKLKYLPLEDKFYLFDEYNWYEDMMSNIDKLSSNISNPVLIKACERLVEIAKYNGEYIPYEVFREYILQSHRIV